LFSLFVETQGDVNEALHLSQRAARKEPSDPQSAGTLGWVYLRKNLSVGALKIVSLLVDQHSNETAFLYTSDQKATTPTRRDC
jgi:hypothetical protein